MTVAERSLGNELKEIGFSSQEQRKLPRHVEWSPDGSCFIVSGEGGYVELYETQRMTSLEPAVKLSESESVRDVAWYPLMNSWDPGTCVFATCCKDTPVHLWDAYSGSLRATYRCFDRMDEICAPYSVSFPKSGEKLYCGFEALIRVFDISSPGRDFIEISTGQKSKHRGLRGVLSTISWMPGESNLLLVGSFSGSVGVFDPRTMQKAGPIAVLGCNSTGVTDICGSPDGNTIFVAGRRDNVIHIWDIRNPDSEISPFGRLSDSNQRIGIDIDRSGTYLYSGDRSGCLRRFDLKATELWEPAQCADDCLSDVSVHPEGNIFCTIYGERSFESQAEPDVSSSSASSDSADEENSQAPAKQISVWKGIHQPQENQS
uniref:Anaphase-promoting complex subunit 4 WD40 domain-containing protein n=1 Tax=Rhodosorus marinus TaxID=101924 RepID=A0A7S3E9X9_9RHOD|mmetsp:Transcript_17041/g.69277  ORF Transcript_17041/g.69277 Transcript_17041/m.69277 type:complete len:374 (+) Transcript_17041:908-2029(+)